MVCRVNLHQGPRPKKLQYQAMLLVNSKILGLRSLHQGLSPRYVKRSAAKVASLSKQANFRGPNSRKCPSQSKKPFFEFGFNPEIKARSMKGCFGLQVSWILTPNVNPSLMPWTLLVHEWSTVDAQRPHSVTSTYYHHK